ncbi:MAG: DUF4136 domain-containing protein [Methylicorpusculum sp.]|uniref:DUF4136 domain-containing protein n=1 Tax=Methylicorpusculum sp. TaxID=2713644 RepID=UPI002719A7C1|nr:DUF4136 domain-containing protein [Methylicorpusculum sp.]MDO8938352.1 DUF4136 domain-containing protein [Methylicorpusculum sp.]MDP2200817.1 DUF4136 domain-containing protein [Methylicorpusculum sp.]
MSTLLQRCLFAALGLSLSACSSVSVTTDYDHSASFDHYRTYTLAPSTDPVGLSPSSETALRDSLRTHLATRNIAEVAGNADLHVVRHISTKEKRVVNQSSYGSVPYRYGRYGMWAGAPPVYTDVSQYTVGTLILDFVDAKSQKLVFRGIATGTVSDPEANAERIREAVEKIVQSYPGGVKP